MPNYGHPIDQHVGRRLRLFRLRQGLSQSDIAVPVGLTFQQIQKYERGVNRMGASRLYEFAHILGVSPAYFFGNLPSDADDTAPDRLVLPAEDRSAERQTLTICRVFPKLPPAHRKAVFELVKALGP